MSFVESIRSFFTPFFSSTLEEKKENGYLFEYGNGGAITGDSMILTSTGLQRVDNINSNTYVKTRNGYSRVIQRVKVLYEGVVYKYQNVYLTAYQPVILNGKCIYPIDMNLESKFYFGYVYDLVLYNQSVILCTDEFFISAINTSYNQLKFSLTDNSENNLKIFKHPYLYTEIIRFDLLLCSNSFDVNVRDEFFVRDIENNMIIGIDVNLARSQNYIFVKTGINVMNEFYDFLNFVTESEHDEIAIKVDEDLKYSSKVVDTMINSIENGKKSTNPEVVDLMRSINNQNADINC